jgi:hypothetical protein
VNAAEAAANQAWISFPKHFPGQSDLLTWCQNMSPGVATLMVIAGIVYLLWGLTLFKALVMLNAAIIGGYIGAFLGQKADGAGVGALLGAMIAAALTWGMMKYAVAVMGGVVGAILGASLWRTTNLEPSYAWAGGMTGMVGFGMLSFILFRGSVMMYTSLQGSVMLIFGVLGLIFKYQSIAPTLNENMTVKPFILPIAIFIPMLVGLVYQQSNGSPAAGSGSGSGSGGSSGGGGKR